MSSTLRVVGAAICRDGRCLVTRRGPSMPLAGQWEFPGGKVEPDETPESALTREIDEELGLAVEVTDYLGAGETIAEGRHIRLDVYAARWVGGTLDLREHDAARWCTASDLDDLEWAAADVPVLAALKAHLRR